METFPTPLCALSVSLIFWVVSLSLTATGLRIAGLLGTPMASTASPSRGSRRARQPQRADSAPKSAPAESLLWDGKKEEDLQAELQNEGMDALAVRAR